MRLVSYMYFIDVATGHPLTSLLLTLLIMTGGVTNGVIDCIVVTQ